jgi:hypothetical protein
MLLQIERRLTRDKQFSRPSPDVFFLQMDGGMENANKTTLARWNSATVEVGAGVGLWRNTAAINSILFKGYATAKYKTGSTFTLYGIKAA